MSGSAGGEDRKFQLTIEEAAMASYVEFVVGGICRCSTQHQGSNHRLLVIGQVDGNHDAMLVHCTSVCFAITLVRQLWDLLHMGPTGIWK